MKEWVLEDFEDPGSSKPFLIDPDTDMVYALDRDERWPALVGIYLPDEDVGAGGEGVKKGSALCLPRITPLTAGHVPH
jgi:hypothetical protein